MDDEQQFQEGNSWIPIILIIIFVGLLLFAPSTTEEKADPYPCNNYGYSSVNC